MNRARSQTLDATATPSSQNAQSQHGNPTKLGPYAIESLIGQGVTGAIFIAYHNQLKRMVALKLLPNFKGLAPDAISTFTQEMAAVSSLSHPNLVTVTDAGSHKGVHYVAMERLDGIDAFHVAQAEGGLVPAVACEIVRQAAAGLHFVHEKGLVHRDLNPSNLMLTKSGVIKILGLGIGILRVAGNSATAFSAQMPESGNCWAPEQYTDSHQADNRADIFALGCTLYHLLCGQPAYRGEKNSSNSEPTPLSEQHPRLSPDLVAVVQRMMATDPANRFQTPNEVVAAMCTWAGGQDIPPLVSRHTSDPAKNTSSSNEEQPTMKSSPAKNKQTPSATNDNSGGWLWPVVSVACLSTLAAVAYGAYTFRPPETVAAPTTPTSHNKTPHEQNDYYHNKLLHQLRSEFGLTGGKWVMTPNEVTYINQAVCYGHTVSQLTTTGQDFTQIVQMRVESEGESPWDAGYFIPEVDSIEAGDRVLMVVWLRTAPNANNHDGKVSVFVEDTSNNAKEVYLTVNPTSEWRQYLIPFQATEATTRRFGFHLAFQEQLIECGGLTLINYGEDVPFASLPYQLDSE